MAASESGQLQLAGRLLFEPDVDWNQPLSFQFLRDILFVLRRNGSGAQLSIRSHRPKEKRGSHDFSANSASLREIFSAIQAQNSCVTRSTSSEVVTPLRTFNHPSLRRLRIPL